MQKNVFILLYEEEPQRNHREGSEGQVRLDSFQRRQHIPSKREPETSNLSVVPRGTAQTEIDQVTGAIARGQYGRILLHRLTSFENHKFS